MNTRKRRVSVALALVLCLSLSPLSSAAPSRDHDDDLRDKIVRILKKAQKFFGGVSALDDILPPRP